MLSLPILLAFIFVFPYLLARPDGFFSVTLRRVLPALLVLVAAFLFCEYKQSGALPSLGRTSNSTKYALAQGYLALWCIYVAASLTWVFAPANRRPWFQFPWKEGSSKAPWLLVNLWLGALLLRIMWPQALIAFAVVAVRAWFRFRAKQGHRSDKATAT